MDSTPLRRPSRGRAALDGCTVTAVCLMKPADWQKGRGLVLGVCLVAMAVHSAWAEDAPLRLASSAALRATVFGPPPQALAALPETVPMEELDFAIEGGLPVPELYWFNRRLRAYLS